MKHMLIITYAIVMDKRNITSWASGYQTLVHQNSSVGLLRPALIPRVSDSMGLGWGWECISDKFPGAAVAAVWGPHSKNHGLGYTPVTEDSSGGDANSLQWIHHIDIERRTDVQKWLFSLSLNLVSSVTLGELQRSLSLRWEGWTFSRQVLSALTHL